MLSRKKRCQSPIKDHVKFLYLTLTIVILFLQMPCFHGFRITRYLRTNKLISKFYTQLSAKIGDPKQFKVTAKPRVKGASDGVEGDGGGLATTQYTSLLKKRRSTKEMKTVSLPESGGKDASCDDGDDNDVIPSREVKVPKEEGKAGRRHPGKKEEIVKERNNNMKSRIGMDDLEDTNAEATLSEPQQDTIISTEGDTEWRSTIEDIIRKGLKKHKLFISKLMWFSQRVEVIVQTKDPMGQVEGNGDSSEGSTDDDVSSPSSLDIQNAHSSIYQEFELREDQLKFNSRFEMIIASPGIGDTLRSDRDFESFKGFIVTVKTSKIFKKKDTFEGSLIGRSAEFVTIANKGRLQNIPRDIVDEVRLPKSKIEPSDIEMRKLAV